MERFRLTILVESRIRWKVYVRFGGEYWETYHRNMTRRRVLSLHNKIVSEVSILLDDASAYEQMSKAINPYGDGKACMRITQTLNVRL